MTDLDEKLWNVKTVGISGHVRPDGDCAGSTLAVYNYIRTYYPDVEVDLYLEPIPDVFLFLKNADNICTHAEEEKAHDVFFVLDCSDEERLGKNVKYFMSAKHTICIDHHISNRGFAEDNYIVPDASSTSELVFELMDAAKITKEIAECIYTGIVHDTGVFQYSCTSPRTMDIAGQMMEKGIDYPKIVDETFYKKTYNQNRILGQALLDSKLYLDGRCIITYLTKAQMEAFGCEPKHLDGIVNQLRVTKGTDVAVFLYENEDGSYKVSLRANGDFNVAEVACAFGGGGHVKAAGCTMEGQIEDIISRLLDAIRLK
uniref:DHH family phosphoesterase n=1 Tax=Agathobacter sp. TaxID=2021311 RepID=UPI004057B006